MNEVEMLALGEALARTSDVLHPGECIPFCDYLERVSQRWMRPATVFGENKGFTVSVDGRLVEGPASTLSVTAKSRVVLYRRQGAALDVLTRGVVRRIWLN